MLSLGRRGEGGREGGRPAPLFPGGGWTKHGIGEGEKNLDRKQKEKKKNSRGGEAKYLESRKGGGSGKKAEDDADRAPPAQGGKEKKTRTNFVQ